MVADCSGKRQAPSPCSTCAGYDRCLRRPTGIDTIAKWLRRQIRNLLGFARAGSNPAGVVRVHLIFFCKTLQILPAPRSTSLTSDQAYF